MSTTTTTTTTPMAATPSLVVEPKVIKISQAAGAQLISKPYKFAARPEYPGGAENVGCH
jgi:hypothetical protein